MSWPTQPLGEVISFIRGITFKPEDQVAPMTDGSVVVMRTKNVQIEGLDESDLISVPASFVKRAEQSLDEGDILLSSANSWGLVGKASYVGQLRYEATAGGFISIVRARKQFIDPRYLYHWITSPSSQHKIRHCGRQTTNISNLDVDRFKGLDIPLPPLEEQKRIATILDKADAIRSKRQQAIQLADEFLCAVFLDMFGDPEANLKEWKVTTLTSCGSFKNGLNFGKGEAGHSLRYLGVGGFKSLKTLDDMDLLGDIELNAVPAKDYFLENGDLVFVRSNGNKALVGRCITVYPDGEPLTFSGFCIRYRVESESVDSEYLNYLFGTASMKNAMLKGGQGANIQNINQEILSRLKIPLPPIELQNKFSRIVKEYRRSMLRFGCAVGEADGLFGAIRKISFQGNLGVGGNCE